MSAIYWFARTADDLADEGSADAAQRLADLEAYGADLTACAAGRSYSERWPHVFKSLDRAMRGFALPPALLHDLLSAFRQDVVKTRDREGYADRRELLDYCSRSANPVGRLLLHLYGVREPEALVQSDRICTALQLINFWQDLGVDLPRGRFYLPAEDCRAHGLDPAMPDSWPGHPHVRQLIAFEAHWARSMMLEGVPLVHRVAGRAGWELRLVTQGGLRVLDRIAASGFDSFLVRPRLRAWDLPLLLWRSARM